VVELTRPQVYLLSDGTGITAETLARTLLTQFEDLQPGWHLRPFVAARNTWRTSTSGSGAVRIRHWSSPPLPTPTCVRS